MSLRWRFVYSIGVCLTILSAPTKGAERKEFLLKYRLSVNTDEEFGGGQPVELVHKKDTSDPFDAIHSIPPPKEEPKYHGEPLYGAIKLGLQSRKMTVVLDNSAGGKLGYDILYVDAQRDGRITKAVKLLASQHGRGTTFGPIKLLIDSGGEKCPQWFLFRLFEYESQGQIQMHFVAVNAGSYQGQVTFGGHKRFLVVIDANGNGVYNDLMKGSRWDCDAALIIDGNRASDRLEREETQPLGQYVLVEDRYWKMDVSADGSSVFVQALDRPLGAIRSEHKDFHALFAGAAGAIRIQSRDGAARLPEGAYQMVQCSYEHIDKDGRRWQFTARGSSEAPALNVVANKTASLRLGPPFVARVGATQSGADLSMNLELRGSGGEVYSDVNLGEGKRPPAPKVRISDDGNRELAILDFHYG